MTWRGFASDNYATVHPAVLDAIARANDRHRVAYGGDELTAQLSDRVREVFGPHAEVFPVFNGTGANVVALQAVCRPWEAVICAQSAHIHVDEGGAPEKIAGLKLWTTPSDHGKLTPALVDQQAWGKGDVHRAQPACVSVSQSTELGTVYTVDELRALVAHAHQLGMSVHLDGARLSNAAASLGVSLAALTTEVGVDLLSFGGTKNGCLLAEAVVVLNPELRGSVPFLRKSAAQLASKTWILSAQLLALLTDDLWRVNAAHANAMAARLARGLRGLGWVEPTRPVQANAVFALLPPALTAALQDRFRFYTWDPHTGEVRLMCAWDTTEAEVDALIAAIGGHRPPG
ncbi:MAG: low specificity L-threonine aldolase [Myxococcota bacterium]